MSTKELYEQYRQHLHKIADVNYAAALLQWDQETYMPAGSSNRRAQQLSTLSEIAHELNVQESLGNLLQELSAKTDGQPMEQKNIELSLLAYRKQKKYTADFVRRHSAITSTAFQNWCKARKENNFSLFEKDLDLIVQLKIEEAALLGYEHHPYDALLNDHDRGSSVAQCDVFFVQLKNGLKVLMDTIKTKPAISNDFLHQHFPKEKQWELGMDMLKLMGYDFQRGRKDIAAHPFTINFSSTDVRVTTRIDERDLCNMLFSTIHEGGHALYEQGLLDEYYGLPLGEPASFTVHESQSRLWENNIGKSRKFWEFYYPKLVSIFQDQLAGIELETFYRAINKVEPSLIRTEADEITYHFHVIIRYEIEKALMTGEIKAKDIPKIWKEKYFDYLGIIVDNDDNGCLQDVHWSHGSFGYFSTYSLGTAMAAQLYAAMEKEMGPGDLCYPEKIGKILFWLRENLFIFGKYYNTNECCKKITGENLNVNFLLSYLEKKFLHIYK